MATFQNQATLNFRGVATNSNIVTGELVEAVSATKTALSGTYRPGDAVTYAVSVQNSGATAANALTVTDDLGAFATAAGTAVPLDYVSGSLRYFVNGAPTATPTVTAENPLTVTGVNIPAGGNALLLYTATVNAAASPAVGGTIVNTATLTGDAVGATPVTATATVTAGEEADLAIRKAIGTGTTVTVGDPLTYTFTVTNTGNTATVTGDNLTVNDTFDPILENITVTLDGVTLVEGTDYTYNGATGEFATVPGRIEVPAATVTEDPTTGAFTVTPGTATLTVTGTV